MEEQRKEGTKKRKKGIDILKSSDVEVDIVQDDFASWYEQFAIGEADKWYSNQIVGGSGCDQNVTCEFGIAHLPDDLNRMNFNMCELIEAGATQLMADIVADPSPWRPEYIGKCVAFTSVRRVSGNHGRAAGYQRNRGRKSITATN